MNNNAINLNFSVFSSPFYFSMIVIIVTFINTDDNKMGKTIKKESEAISKADNPARLNLRMFPVNPLQSVAATASESRQVSGLTH